MKSGNKLFIFTGAALAVVAILLVITMSSGGNKTEGQDEAPDNGKVTVIKAAVDFEPHRVMSMADLLIEELPADQVPVGYISEPTSVLGQSYTLGAVKGDILLASYVEPPGITNSIDPGMRAVSLSVDTQGLMSGLIMDGDYIDVVFKARIDLQRVVNVLGLEISEDGDYVFKDAGGGQNTGGNSDNTQPDDDGLQITGADGTPYQGKPDSEFTVLDAGIQLEPVSKILVQNIKIIRVVPPGVSYGAQGQQVQATADDNNPAETINGQLILQVTPAQAEVIAFVQDQNHSYEVVVRGKEDNEIVNTSGITFQILMTNEEWAMPYPVPLKVPGAEAATEE